MIEDEYIVNWMIDNLPAATRYLNAGKTDGSVESYTYADGFFVGVIQDGRYFVHNHVLLDMKYHTDPAKFEGHRIVGFEVEPHSFTQYTAEDINDPSGYSASCWDSAAFELENHNEIFYTYDVRWTESDVRWASRWDGYLKMQGGKIHWFAIINSLMILVFLSGMVAMILLRTLHRDITKYNEIATAEEKLEDTGWKLVHGDVFRRPMYSTLLSVSVGSGLQIFGMCVVTLIFALLGFLSPAHRGGLLQCMTLLFTLMGSVAGYGSARCCKLFSDNQEGDTARWKLTTILTAFLYPGFIFVVFFVLNLFIWGQKSSGAVPFTTMFALVVLWFGVSVPLVLLGAHAGQRQPPIELPVRICPIPRQIPEQPAISHPLLTCMAGGILPFGAVFAELFFVMASIWQHQFYYLFGFLGMVLAILVVTCAEISIALVYFQLTSEDYQWWWNAFFCSGTSGLYLFLYSIFYFNTRLHIDKLVPTLLYLGYMGVASVMFCLLTGSIGLIASFFFVRAIYGSIKVD
jgi:transmembrane 9 superfamily protein 2/4